MSRVKKTRKPGFFNGYIFTQELLNLGYTREQIKTDCFHRLYPDPDSAFHEGMRDALEERF